MKPCWIRAHSNILILTWSHLAKTVFPGKASFTDTGGQDFAVSFGGCNSACNTLLHLYLGWIGLTQCVTLTSPSLESNIVAIQDGQGGGSR